MTFWKISLIATCTALIGLGAGAFGAKQYLSKHHNDAFERLMCLEMQHQVIVLEAIQNQNIELATKKLESQLNVNILSIGPNPYHPRVLSDDVKEALRTAKNYRVKHPFSTSSKGVNQMIQDAFNAAN